MVLGEIMQIYKSRDEVEDKYKWDLSDFYKDNEDFYKNLDLTYKEVQKLVAYNGCTKDANKLYEFLQKQLEAICSTMNLYAYANLKNDEFLGVSENIEMMSKVNELDTLLDKNISFFDPELLKLTTVEYERLYVSNPKLKEFKSSLDKIYRNKKHVLSEKEEIIISQLLGAMGNYSNMSSTLLNNQHDYGKIKLDDGTVEKIAPTNYRKIMRKSNQKNRKKIYNMYHSVIEQYAQTEAEYLSSYIKTNNTVAKIHHFKNAWDRKLFRLNIDDKVYDTLVTTTQGNLRPLRRYFDIKRQALKLDKLHLYDLPLEMAPSSMEYSIDDAQKIVREAIKPLGNKYLECYDEIINKHYVDYCQYPGKCSGGYSLFTLDRDSRILMSFNYDLDSVSTLAHEAGHNVNHQLVKENNPTVYRNTTSLVAEVVSLTNECLLSSYLASDKFDLETRKAGISNFLGVFVSNFYGAVREGKMEQDMYQYIDNGGVLTKDYLNKLSYDSCKKYYGKSVVLDKYAGYYWALRSHYYMDFYLYSYAICVSVASYIASKILIGDKDILEKYMKFLTLGSDIWANDAFLILGIDLTDKKVYEEAISYFSSMLDKYENLSKEM